MRYNNETTKLKTKQELIDDLNEILPPIQDNKKYLEIIKKMLEEKLYNLKSAEEFARPFEVKYK